MLGREHLHGSEPVEQPIPGLVDDAHTALAQFAQDLVAGNLGVAGSDGIPRPARLDGLVDGELHAELRRQLWKALEVIIEAGGFARLFAEEDFVVDQIEDGRPLRARSRDAASDSFPPGRVRPDPSGRAGRPGGG